MTRFKSNYCKWPVRQYISLPFCEHVNHPQRQGGGNALPLCYFAHADLGWPRSCVHPGRCSLTTRIAIAEGFQEKCHSSQQVMRFDIWHQSIIKTTPAAEEAVSFKRFSRRKGYTENPKGFGLFSLQTIRYSKEKKRKKSKSHKYMSENKSTLAAYWFKKNYEYNTLFWYC